MGKNRAKATQTELSLDHGARIRWEELDLVTKERVTDLVAELLARSQIGSSWDVRKQGGHEDAQD